MLYILCYILVIIHDKFYIIYYVLYIIHYILYIVYYIFYIYYIYTIYMIDYVLYILLYILYIRYYIFCSHICVCCVYIYIYVCNRNPAWEAILEFRKAFCPRPDTRVPFKARWGLQHSQVPGSLGVGLGGVSGFCATPDAKNGPFGLS